MAHKYSLIQGFIVSSLLAAGSTVGLPAAAQTPPAAPPAPAPAPAEAVPAPAPTPAPVGTSPAAPAAAEPAPASPTITLVPAPAATVPPAAATTPAPAEVPVPEKPAKPGEASKLQIASADGQNKLEFHALLDADGRFFLTDKGGIGTFLVRRARPSIDAKLFRYFELTIVPEFAGSRFTILEGFGNVHLWDALQLRVGKGKPPVGLERLQSSRDTMFPETALPTLLVPNRDVGAQLHGKVADGAFEWAFGVYNGVPNGQIGETDTNDSKDVEARVFVHPFKPTDIDALKGLGLGVAGTIGNEQGPVGPYVTSGGATFFAYGSTVNGLGKRTLVTPQAYYYGGPVGAMFEVVRVRDHYATPTGATGTVGTTAWALQAAFVLGGKETWKGVKVDAPLDPEKGGFGAFELGARYGALRVGDVAFKRGFASRNNSAQLATQWGLVGSWHFADGNHLRVSYERTNYRGGAAGGEDKKPELLLLTRLQAAF
jgi:phosphate-selective porin OprO and OprP